MNLYRFRDYIQLTRVERRIIWKIIDSLDNLNRMHECHHWLPITVCVTIAYITSGECTIVSIFFLSLSLFNLYPLYFTFLFFSLYPTLLRFTHLTHFTLFLSILHLSSHQCTLWQCTVKWNWLCSLSLLFHLRLRSSSPIGERENGWEDEGSRGKKSPASDFFST